MAIFTVLTGALDCNTPRTCTPENAIVAITGDNPKIVQDEPPIYIADLAINPETGQADFTNSHPILSQEEDNPQLKENMQQLLEMILGFFEEETRKVDNGELKEENMLLEAHDVQTDNTNTKRPIRQLPSSFNRRRA